MLAGEQYHQLYECEWRKVGWSDRWGGTDDVSQVERHAGRKSCLDQTAIGRVADGWRLRGDAPSTHLSRVKPSADIWSRNPICFRSAVGHTHHRRTFNRAKTEKKLALFWYIDVRPHFQTTDGFQSMAITLLSITMAACHPKARSTV